MLRTDIKRNWLRRQWALVPGTYATLLAAIQAEAFKQLDAVKGGSVAATTSQSGSFQRSVSFSNSDHGATQGDFAELGGEMLDLYDASNAALIAAGIGSPTDLQRFTEMMDRLKPVTELTNQFVNLRAVA